MIDKGGQQLSLTAQSVRPPNTPGLSDPAQALSVDKLLTVGRSQGPMLTAGARGRGEGMHKSWVQMGE